MNTKQVISKLHWKFASMLFFTIVPSLSVFIFVLKKHIENSQNQMGIGGWIFLGSFVSFGILFFIRYIVLFERFTITEKSICIEYPILGKKLEYKNDDLIKWYEHINYGRFGEYKSFHFKTSDNKIFMFVDYQFSNYKELIISISGKVKFDYINKMHNLKFLFIHWIISVLIVSLVILIVLKLII